MATKKITSIDQYIDSCSAEVQPMLQTLRKLIHQEIPKVEEVISYNMPCFKSNGKYIIYFAVWKSHIGMYPTSGEMVKSIKELSEYETSGKGTVKIPLDRPLPTAMIRKIVQFRLKESRERS